LPDRVTEYYVYQTLVGVWPVEPQRLVDHMLKATREAKLQTSWMEPNARFEDALVQFVHAIVADQAFNTSFEAFVKPLRQAAVAHSLSQTLLKLCAPGVPDIYQANECFDFSLADPDNRRPVDFERRTVLLGRLDSGDPWHEPDTAKLWVTRQALRLRKRRSECFGPSGDYVPLLAQGAGAQGVIAFCRGGSVVALATRGLAAEGRASLATLFGTTRLMLPAGRYHNLLTGSQVADGETCVAQLLEQHPVALLERSRG
jgi:(1->4)-alpha-D-glucan 1-alpha-D-glucosylmutase